MAAPITGVTQGKIRISERQFGIKMHVSGNANCDASSLAIMLNAFYLCIAVLIIYCATGDIFCKRRTSDGFAPR